MNLYEKYKRLFDGKDTIADLISSAGIDDLPEDLRDAYEERAAIMEYDGELPREHAEHRAMQIIRKLR